MATIESGNWSFRDPGDDIPDGSVINGGNFSQLVPNTEILVGKTLTINGGNFTNVKPQATWTINRPTWTQKSFCSHLHPEWIALGMTECAENCSHVVSSEDIVVGGQVIDTVYTYQDTVV